MQKYVLKRFNIKASLINLSYDGGFIDLSYDGGGGVSKCPSIFICENNRKSDKIMHCVEEFFF